MHLLYAYVVANVGVRELTRQVVTGSFYSQPPPSLDGNKRIEIETEIEIEYFFT